MSLDPAVRRHLCIRRITLGITQRQLAARMNTSQSWISSLENGGVDGPTVSMLERWAEALGLQMRISFDDIRDNAEAGAA